MNRFFALLDRVLRGARVANLLRRFGIDPRTYWLLLDLFAQLSDRGELMDQLGNDLANLQKLAWMYFAMSSLMALGMAAARPSAENYSLIFLGFTAVALLMVLALEAGNSLVNPTEAMVLAHHPIGGATYIGAKLTHLLRIVLYLVPGLNALPALVMVWLPGAHWWSAVTHLAEAFGVGILMALLCCAAFGWLLRFVPAPRMKAAAQLITVIPFLFLFLPQLVNKAIAQARITEWLPQGGVMRWTVVAGVAALALWVIVAGIRCLSLDYLLRVSAITRGSSRRVAVRRSRMGDAVGRCFGGPAARAGFGFVSRMMRRDWQFRRQLIPALVGVGFGFGGLLVNGWRKDPFAEGFTTAHLFPHIFGIVLFFICCFLPYGNDYKGAWVFLLAPSTAFRGFAQGVHALLWMVVLGIPHVLALALFAWSWGPWHASLFTAYSLAAGSLYLAMALRLVDGPPFAQQVDPKRGAMLLPLMIGGGFLIALVVGLQYLLLFRSVVAAGAAAVVIGSAAWLLTRHSIGVFETSMRYRLGVLSEETGTLYQEVNA